MPTRTVHVCACPACQQEPSHPDQAAHQRLNLLVSRLDEQQRRWLVAHEAQCLGYGGDKLLSVITVLDEKTLARGRQELAEGLSTCPDDRIRQRGGGRPLAEKNDTLEPTLLALLEPETAGDPMSEQKWVRSSLRHIAARLKQKGKAVCAVITGRLLRKHKYAPRVNVKRVAGASMSSASQVRQCQARRRCVNVKRVAGASMSSASQVRQCQARRRCVNVKRVAGASHPDRNRQFEYLTAQKQAFLDAGQPIISVDTKKKEWVGNFKNAGACWCQEAQAVTLHDFPQDALGRAVPYGIYDVSANCGSVYVGQSADTPEFAVTASASWWESEGVVRYPAAKSLLILCDAGGSNGCRPRVWKQQLQGQLSDRFGLEVTVCHYPTSCSKWNPIEYRLFSPISRHWSGIPLRTFENERYRKTGFYF